MNQGHRVITSSICVPHSSPLREAGPAKALVSWACGGWHPVCPVLPCSTCTSTRGLPTWLSSYMRAERRNLVWPRRSSRDHTSCKCLVAARPTASAMPCVPDDPVSSPQVTMQALVQLSGACSSTRAASQGLGWWKAGKLSHAVRATQDHSDVEWGVRAGNW